MFSRETSTNLKNKIINVFREGGLPEPSQTQLGQFDAYFNYLIEENKKYNLTGITDPDKAATDHFYDSVMPVGLIKDDSKVIDIGTGAGFPVVPLAIMQPNAGYTAVDATEKKCEFLKRVCEIIGVKTDVLCGRAEQLIKENTRGKFDICVSRAVARLNVLIELCAPFIAVEGRFFAYKSDPNEVIEAENAAKILNLELELCVPSLIPGNGHKIFVYRKTGDTSGKYPRPYAKIKKSPL